MGSDMLRTGFAMKCFTIDANGVQPDDASGHHRRPRGGAKLGCASEFTHVARLHRARIRRFHWPTSPETRWLVYPLCASPAGVRCYFSVSFMQADTTFSTSPTLSANLTADARPPKPP